MTEAEFIAELKGQLRVGRLAQRRIVLEISEHLRSLEDLNNSDVANSDRLGSPRELAEDFNTSYAAHRQARLSTLAHVSAFGFAATLVACALLLTGDADGDRNLWPELLLVAISTGAIGIGLTSQRYRLLATSLGLVGVGWLVWSLRLIQTGAGLACLLLLVVGLVGAGATDSVARSLRQRVS